MSVNWLYHRPERHDQQPNTTNFVGQKLVAVRGSGMGHNTADDGVADSGSAIIGQDQQRVDDTVTTLSKDGPACSITADPADRIPAERVRRQSANEHADATLLVNAAGFSRAQQNGHAIELAERHGWSEEPPLSAEIVAACPGQQASVTAWRTGAPPPVSRPERNPRAALPADLLSRAENCGRTVSIGDQRQDAPAALNQSSVRTTATRPWSGLAPSLLAVSPTAVERQPEVQP
jgi:hypothetical protein